jgi:Cys-tRNA(Pro) deacylase
MAKSKYPITQAVRFLRANRVDFKPHTYGYCGHGGTAQAAAKLDIPLHRVVKTLVMETGESTPLLALMHGDRTVSTRQLAKAVGKKKIHPMHPDKAMRCTGYQVGGISPFGTRQAMSVYVQASILSLASIFINGGKRGFLIEIEPFVLLDQLAAIPVNMATAGD